MASDKWLCGVEAEGSASDQPQPCVERLHASVGEALDGRRDDAGTVMFDGVGRLVG
jgi:hypothetical protein